MFARGEAAHGGKPLLDVARRTFIRGRCFVSTLYWLFDLSQQPQHHHLPQYQLQPLTEAQLLASMCPTSPSKPSANGTMHRTSLSTRPNSSSTATLVGPMADVQEFPPMPSPPLLPTSTSYRVVSVEMFERALEGTCAYVPVPMRTLEFFTGLLVVQQPKAALAAMTQFIRHHRIGFVRVLDVRYISVAGYRSSIGWPGYSSNDASSSTYLAQLACLVLQCPTLRVATAQAWSKYDAPKFAIGSDRSALVRLCQGASSFNSSARRIAHGLHTWAPSPRPVLCDPPYNLTLR